MSESQRPPDDPARPTGAGQPPQPAGPPPMAPMPSWPDEGTNRPAVEQPQHVRAAVRLMYVGAALSLVSILFGFGQTAELRRQAARQLRTADQKVTPEQLDTAVTASLAITVVIGLILVGIWVLLGYKTGRGRTWARTVATILGVLNVVLTALSLGGASVTGLTGVGLQEVISVLIAVVALVVVVLLWTQQSRAWFDQFATRRR